MIERRKSKGWKWMKHFLGFEPERRISRGNSQPPKPEHLRRPTGVVVPKAGE